MKSWHLTAWTLTALAACPVLVRADIYNTLLDTSKFGSVNQYVVPAADHTYGPTSCCPTATANAFAFLQNQFPSIYGNSLVAGGTSDGIVATATTLASASYMNTNSSNGTTAQNWVAGEVSFLNNYAPNKTLFGGMGEFYIDTSTYPLTMLNFVNADPTFDFLYGALQDDAGIELGMYPTNGIGHVITLVGLNWNDGGNHQMIDQSEGATMTYVDPLDGQLHTCDIWQTTPGGTIQTDYYGAGDTGTLVLATTEIAVPEPAALALLGGGVLLLLRMRRR